MTTLETLLTDPDASGAWAMVPDSSKIEFKTKNLWGVWPVKGRFTKFSGEGRLGDNGAVTGHIDIDVASLNTGIEKRDGHLRSPDFFDVERFPQIAVAVSGLQLCTGREAELQTGFTIKGITEPVRLPVTITELADGSVRISGTTQIERSRFNLDWNKLGVMSDTVTVSAEAVFVQSTHAA